MGNRSGQAYAFMSMTPIRAGQEDEVERKIAAWPSAAMSPLGRMGTTHFGRFLVLRNVLYEGEPQVRDTLASPYLIFVTNFDGTLEAYLDGMLDLMPGECAEAFGLCIGCPPIDDREAFIAYLLHNQIETTFFASAYPEATVEDVHQAAALRRQVSDFVVAGQALPAQDLMQQWRAAFAGVEK